MMETHPRLLDSDIIPMLERAKRFAGAWTGTSGALASDSMRLMGDREKNILDSEVVTTALGTLSHTDAVDLCSLSVPGSKFSRLVLSMQANPSLGGLIPIAVRRLKSGQIVSWASATDDGESYRVSAFTHPSHRRRGYATACVRSVLLSVTRRGWVS